MRAFVTGGTGFLGYNLIRQLVDDEWEIIAFHRPTSNTKRLAAHPEVTLAQGQIYDFDSVEAAIPDNCDAVFHVAGNTSLWRGGDTAQTRDNVEGTRAMVRASLARGVRRFIHTSSVAAYGRHQDTITESTPSIAMKTGSNYQRTKYLAEEEVKAAVSDGLDAVILNPGNIVGPYDENNWGRLLRLVESEKLPGVPPGAAVWGHAREIARAHIEAFHRGRTGENYLLGGDWATMLDVVQIIGELTGKKVPSKASPKFLLYTVGTVNDFLSLFTGREPSITRAGADLVCGDVRIDSSKAERDLDYKSTSIEEMFRDCYQSISESTN